MLGRHRKLNLGATWSEEHSEGCVLLGSTAVYRRLMDPFSSCSNSDDSVYPKSVTNYDGNRGYTTRRKRFEKSESEDSGVELPPPSPLGSESSYNPDESESIEGSTPEDPESLESPTLENCKSQKGRSFEKTNYFKKIQEGVIWEQSSPEKSGESDIYLQKAADSLEYFVNEQKEKDNSSVPHKLEQAILRSRRQRSSSREAIQSRAARCNRHYAGSLKDNQRGKHFCHQARSPVCQTLEKEEQDALLLPGDGLRYLENLCHMLEQMAELQQRNQRLQIEKREAQERLRNQVLFLDACVCGSSRDSRDLEQDTTDNQLPSATTWRPQHYRQRSSSHAGVMLTLARRSENTLRENNKLNPQYVSVPNLQEAETQRTSQNLKTEASQWFSVKSLLSRLSRKNSGSAPLRESHSNCRSQKGFPKNCFNFSEAMLNPFLPQPNSKYSEDTI
ncbi:uncharacterized protein C8orf58 homolog [Gastrophryne carolinensis]